MTDSMREKLYRSEAIVLSRMDYGEADRILVILTPARGKLDVIAKGARKAQSRLGPQLDYFARVNLELARGRELDVVRSVESIDRFALLRENLEAFGHASYFVELVRNLTQPREEHRELYDLLARSLVLLNEKVDPWAIARHFELALLTALGYRPELFHCVNCRQPIQPEVNAFSAELGGLLCPRCRNEDLASIPLSLNAQKYLRLLERGGLAAAARIKPGPADKIEIQQVTSHYVRHVAERDFHSLRVLGALQQATLELAPGSG
ncbi:MAG TPA: DNA repair protein RecO [Thermomicrobiales bacterium]|nr:DNA repair protein RecO [Thermomicrobiales bacterium]